MSELQSNIPLETVAAITAALAAMLEQPVDSFVITNITPEQNRPLASVWAKAGVLESHLARRQFGIRSR